MQRIFQRTRVWVVLLSFLWFLPGCGGADQPFLMTVDGILFVGQIGLVNPEQQAASGTLEAQVAQVFSNRSSLDVLNLDLVFQTNSVGPISLELDPNNPSSMTVFMVGANGQVLGTHQLILNLIIVTPEQNLVLSGVTLQSDTAVLTLAMDLPPLGFSFQGQSMQLDLTSLEVVIPVELIQSNFDPQ